MLTNLALSNFKAFKKLDLELRPLTLLLGPNNSGKSSTLASIRLLAQTLAAGDPGVALLLDGPFGDFGTFTDVVFQNNSSSTFRIRLEGTGQDNIRRTNIDRWSMDAEFGYRSRRRQLILNEVEIADSEGHVLTAAYVPDSDRHVVSKMRGQEVASRFRGRTHRSLMLMNFLPYLALHRSGSKLDTLFGGLFSEDELFELDRRIDAINFAIRRDLMGTEFIGAMRVPPERTYHQTGEGRARIGANGENWTGILVLDSSRGGHNSRKMRGQLGAWLRQAGLASEVRLNWLSNRHYEVQIRNPVSREIENLADVGQGNSQVIPVILGGLGLNSGNLYMVEEPEIHLHPRAQADLGDYFGALCQAGVRSIVETHSEYLVLRVQQLVASTGLDPSQVAFYYTEASSRANGKTVRKLTLDEHARFEQDMKGGFFPQKLDEARKLARLRS